ncbi:MAG: EamA family transporter [Terriglobales bacterium]
MISLLIMSPANSTSRWRVILAFGLIYFFWGSTYLAIDVAVKRIPPAVMCGVRFLTAGVFMLAFCGIRGRKIAYSWGQLVHMAMVGVLLLVGGNLTLAYAETHIGSGLAALIVAIIPLWFLILDRLLLGDHDVPLLGKVGLALGLIGMIVLLWPDLTATSSFGRVQLWASLSLLGGAFCWALGSVLSKKWKSAEVDSFSATAWQMIAAGAASLLIAAGMHDFSGAVWTPRATGAVLYLIVCGSWVGYTAYIWLLNHASTSKVSTYAYVNPIVAVFLGWLVLHEKVDGYILAGSAIVIASVVLVTSAKVKPRISDLRPVALEAAND